MNDLLKVIGQFTDDTTAARIAEALVDAGYVTLKFGDKDVSAVVEAFKAAFGTTGSNRYDRYAAKRLTGRYSVLEIKRVISVLAEHQGDQYCPVIGSVLQLEQKWVSVGRYLTRLQSDSEIAV